MKNKILILGTMLRSKLIVLLLFIVANSILAQTDSRYVIDSSLNAISKIKTDTGKAYCYLSVAFEYKEIDTDTSLLYTQKALKLFQKASWDEGALACYYLMGMIYSDDIYDYDKALEYFNKELKGYQKLDDTLGIAEAYANIGMVYEYTDKFADALKYYFKSLNLSREVKDKELELSSLMNIGNVYGTVEEQEKSMDYYNKALKINEELGLEYDEALLLINIAVEYATSEEYDKALEYNQKALKILEKIDEPLIIAHVKENLGGIYYDMGKYNKAMNYLGESSAYFTKVDDKEYIVDNLVLKGSIYVEVATDKTGFMPDSKFFSASDDDNLQRGLDYLQQAKAMYDKGEVNSVSGLAGVYEMLSVAYEATGDVDKAFDSYKEFIQLQDSLLAQEDDKKIAQLEGQRAVALKDKELELQKLSVAKRRNEQMFLVGGILLLFILLGVTYRSLRQRGVSNRLLAAEKHKSEELLLNILPEEVADELKEKGSADATHFDAVTVLFTDFVAFSKASERMSSQELVDELHTCFKAFDEITAKYEIEKIKTIGDAYLAVCGLPVKDEKHAENVVSAAIEILEFTKERRAKLGDKTFDIRIGVHSGDVVAGIVGVKKFAYDIWGDTVNTAARMEQNSVAGKINISGKTYELVKDKFPCTYRGELEAKNKGKLKMYFVEV